MTRTDKTTDSVVEKEMEQTFCFVGKIRI
jgi:hypothetical protein